MVAGGRAGHPIDAVDAELQTPLLTASHGGPCGSNGKKVPPPSPPPTPNPSTGPAQVRPACFWARARAGTGWAGDGERARGSEAARRAGERPGWAAAGGVAGRRKGRLGELSGGGAEGAGLPAGAGQGGGGRAGRGPARAQLHAPAAPAGSTARPNTHTHTRRANSCPPPPHHHQHTPVAARRRPSPQTRTPEPVADPARGLGGGTSWAGGLEGVGWGVGCVGECRVCGQGVRASVRVRPCACVRVGMTANGEEKGGGGGGGGLVGGAGGVRHSSGTLAGGPEARRKGQINAFVGKPSCVWPVSRRRAATDA